MTAADALKMTAGVSAVEIEEKAKLVLKYWHQAIEKAAKTGQRSVSASQVDRPRTPVPTAANTAALSQLQADGFTVAVVSNGTGGEMLLVSW
jgi:hypothetical protein